MSLDLISEVYRVLVDYVDRTERKDAADALVNLLVDFNIEADEIRDAFRGEKDILTALKDYISTHESEEEYDDYDEQEEDW